MLRWTNLQPVTNLLICKQKSGSSESLFCCYLVQLEYSKESLLRHFDIANLLHTLLTTLLFLKQFAFAAYITTVAFGKHILANLLNRFACEIFAPIAA